MMFRKGKMTFKTKEAKEAWILSGILHSLEYIGKETKLSHTENELRKLAVRELKQIIAKKKR